MCYYVEGACCHALLNSDIVVQANVPQHVLQSAVNIACRSMNMSDALQCQEHSQTLVRGSWPQLVVWHAAGFEGVFKCL